MMPFSFNVLYLVVGHYSYDFTDNEDRVDRDPPSFIDPHHSHSPTNLFPSSQAFPIPTRMNASSLYIWSMICIAGVCVSYCVLLLAHAWLVVLKSKKKKESRLVRPPPPPPPPPPPSPADSDLEQGLELITVELHSLDNLSKKSKSAEAVNEQQYQQQQQQHQPNPSLTNSTASSSGGESSLQEEEEEEEEEEADGTIDIDDLKKRRQQQALTSRSRSGETGDTSSGSKYGGGDTSSNGSQYTKSSGGTTGSVSTASAPPQMKLQQQQQKQHQPAAFFASLSAKLSGDNKHAIPVVVPPILSEFTVHCGSGKLGIILETSDDGPIVFCVKPSSPLLGIVHHGCVLLSIDEIDLSRYTAKETTALIAERGDNISRKIRFSRDKKEGGVRY
jgi:hypothetical protein